MSGGSKAPDTFFGTIGDGAIGNWLSIAAIGSFILAVGLPLLIIYIRQVVKDNRQKLIEQFKKDSLYESLALRSIESKYSPESEGGKLFICSLPFIFLSFFLVFILHSRRWQIF